MKKYIALFLLGFLLALSGCASVQPVQQANLTPGMAKTKIIKGQTTQNEILQVFGPPNIVTKNKSGNEVWTYDKVSVESGSSDVYGTLFILGGAGSRSSTSARTFTLMIEFDDKDVVKDFSYRSSAF
ncbi:MAG: lipoprotein [Candidatus Omnitrophica bacterium]|nr:lipoprotein [Candidatus Omnitrophota bacterium]